MSKISKKKKKGGEVLCMLFKITHIWFNEPDCVTLHTVMNIMAENGAKLTKMALLALAEDKVLTFSLIIATLFGVHF